MEPVGDLESVRGTAPGTLGVGARPVPADDLHAGVRGQATRPAVPASRVGSTSTTRWSSTLDQTVAYDWPRRIAKSSTPSTRGVLNCGSGSAMTLRNKVIRPAPKPSWAASRAPARPASASPTRSRARLSRAGEPCVRGGQPAERLGERPARAVRRAADEAPDRQPDHEALLSERKVSSACAGSGRGPGPRSGRSPGTPPRPRGLSPPPRPCRTRP